jgi:hypothetical protein
MRPLLIPALTAAVLLCGAPVADERQQDFVLRLEGGGGLVQIRCIEEGPLGEHRIELEVVPPHEERFRGFGLECTFYQVTGVASVDITLRSSRGNIARANVAGRGSTTTIRMR